MARQLPRGKLRLTSGIKPETVVPGGLMSTRLVSRILRRATGERVKLRYLVAVTLGAASIALGSAAAAVAAPYEPNDTKAQATGPLTSPGGSFAASLETANDVDIFKFYVATPGTQVALHLLNGAASTESADDYGRIVQASFYDTNGKPVGDSGAVAEIGQSDDYALSLRPGRFFIAVQHGGDLLFPEVDPLGNVPYTLQVQGNFASYELIGALCQNARAKKRHAHSRAKKRKARKMVSLYCSIPQ